LKGYANAIIVVNATKGHSNSLVDVMWGDKKLVMLYEDIQRRDDLAKRKPISLYPRTRLSAAN
jgi:hypothetical protein